MSVVGVIFDLDGTLVDSGLDFGQMRRDMKLAADDPILESLEEMSPQRRTECEEILARHEREGVARATVYEGLTELLDRLVSHQTKLAILTRNRADCARATVEATLPGYWDPIISRDEGPIKPDPWGIEEICRQWRAAPADVVMIGDYLFDIQAGLRAGARTALFARGRDRANLAGTDLADLVFDSFDCPQLASWLDKPI
jgi:HAD superfamily hydrolase (TIGR01509 family)